MYSPSASKPAGFIFCAGRPSVNLMISPVFACGGYGAENARLRGSVVVQGIGRAAPHLIQISNLTG